MKKEINWRKLADKYTCKNCIYKHEQTCTSPRMQKMICIDDDFSCGDIKLKKELS